MRKSQWQYYNYFLILSMFLISGYFITSLVFVIKSTSSGERADFYASVTEQADQLLQNAFQMESSAFAYALSRDDDFKKKFSGSKCAMNQSFEALQNQCVDFDRAIPHVVKLEGLLSQKIAIMDSVIHSDEWPKIQAKTDQSFLFRNRERMDEISEVLNDIRVVSAHRRDENKAKAVETSQDILFILSIFGIVMIFIVIISFDRMRKEIKQNEEKSQEILKINAELKSVNQNLENFAYIASHDLNEPLRKIRTFGDLISEEFNQSTPDIDQVKNYIKRMHSSSERMQQLIADLLSYSRITLRVEDMKEINLNKIVKNVQSDLQVAIKETDAVIDVKSLPDSIKAEPIQMRQLFQNIISNALKFRKKDSTPEITIWTEVTTFNDQMPNKYWKISIQDNGIGLDMQFKDKIFAVFQRLHGRSSYEGTGVGLSICKKIVEQHKGCMDVDSKVGEGTTFIIYLPQLS